MRSVIQASEVRHSRIAAVLDQFVGEHHAATYVVRANVVSGTSSFKSGAGLPSPTHPTWVEPASPTGSNET
jgi:hypothetical protein